MDLWPNSRWASPATAQKEWKKSIWHPIEAKAPEAAEATEATVHRVIRRGSQKTLMGMNRQADAMEHG